MRATASVAASKWNSTTPYFQTAGRRCRREGIDQLSGPPSAAPTCSRDAPILSGPKAPERRNSRIETLMDRVGGLITGWSALSLGLRFGASTTYTFVAIT